MQCSRFLDLRFEYISSLDIYYIHEGLLGISIDDIILDLSSFSDITNDIVIISLSNFISDINHNQELYNLLLLFESNNNLNTYYCKKTQCNIQINTLYELYSNDIIYILFTDEYPSYQNDFDKYTDVLNVFHNSTKYFNGYELNNDTLQIYSMAWIHFDMRLAGETRALFAVFISTLHFHSSRGTRIVTRWPVCSDKCCFYTAKEIAYLNSD